MIEVSSLLPSAIALGVVFVVSVILTAMRPALNPDVKVSARFSLIISMTILVQLVHFTEELRTSFYIKFPAVFGNPPISESIFFWFNVAWLVIWALALLAIRAGIVIALCPLWFLALAMVLNMVAHPLLALRTGGYFPGLFTSPVAGLFGILATWELIRLTAAKGQV